MNFVNREVEVERIRQAAANAPELVVVRGRRRVGKSALLDRSLAGQRGVFFQADEQPTLAQLELFGREVSTLLPGNPPVRFSDWDEALQLLGDLARQKPLVAVLDEFQWLWQSDPHLDSKLQRHWDTWERANVPITFVLSGSSLTLMEKLLDHSSPLYGRARYRPLLQPLDFRRAAEFAAADTTAAEKILRYAVLGGTPQYQVWAGEMPLKEFIASKILAKDEALHEEPLHLLRAEQQMRDPGTYFTIVAAIARGNTRLAEIGNQTGIQTPNLSKMLHRLIELGYVEHRSPLTPGNNPGRGSYRIIDPYFRFWFRFVSPNRSRLARGRVTEVLQKIEQDLPTFAGPVFEDCCRDWIGAYAPTSLIPPPEQLGSWWSRDGQNEIDIVGVTKARYSLLGSCKWDQTAPGSVLLQLLRHQEVLGPKATQAQLIIFARGFSTDLRRHAAEHGVRLVAADELFGGQ